MHQQHVNCLINRCVFLVQTLLFIACDTAFYAIMFVTQAACMSLTDSHKTRDVTNCILVTVVTFLFFFLNKIYLTGVGVDFVQ